MTSFDQIIDAIFESLSASDVDFSPSDTHLACVDFDIPMVANIRTWDDDGQTAIAVRSPRGVEHYRVTFTSGTPLEVIGHAVTGIAISLIASAA